MSKSYRNRPGGTALTSLNLCVPLVDDGQKSANRPTTVRQRKQLLFWLHKLFSKPKLLPKNARSITFGLSLKQLSTDTSYDELLTLTTANKRTCTSQTLKDEETGIMLKANFRDFAGLAIDNRYSGSFLRNQTREEKS